MPKGKKGIESYQDIERRAEKLDALINLSNSIRKNEKRMPIPFNDFLYLASKEPEFVFRDIHQLFHDMMHYYVPSGRDENNAPDESIGFVDYDTNDLFVRGTDDPFFADRLFANRLMNLAEDFKKGTQKNRIYLFEGPPGSGKSTFLNNLLHKFEEYTKTPEGTTFKVFWRLNVEKLGGFNKTEELLHEATGEIADDSARRRRAKYPDKVLEFSSPHHDHPILMIPKDFRSAFLDELLPDSEFKERLFSEKEYEWVFRNTPGSVSGSIYQALVERMNDPLDVYSMLWARPNYFNRQLGEGISVFNPGDVSYTKPIRNVDLEYMLNELIGETDVKFIYSYLAKTNNGILALMDIKENNVGRLLNYHGIISDGVHKVELTEERVKTLFLGLVNPEDKVHYEQIKSFQDRIITVKIPYVLDYNTEVMIYKKKFSDKMLHDFLPGVLENFAKIIISTRLERQSPEIRKWITHPDKYAGYLDKNMLLLKMDVYTGKIPDWLTEEDFRRFDRKTRRALIDASEQEGFKGISGRMSLNVFNDFASRFTETDDLITMEDLRKYVLESKSELFKDVPPDLVNKIIDLYDYDVLQQVRDAIYYYNEKHISREIKNYLYAINYELGDTRKSPHTGDTIEITEYYLEKFEMMILGTKASKERLQNLRASIQSEYISRTLSQEIRVEGKDITETTQFKELFGRYTKNLKENALTPYADNANFRRAIKALGTKEFQTFDDKLKRDVIFLIKNLQEKFRYTEAGACQVSIYVLDRNLSKKYEG